MSPVFRHGRLRLYLLKLLDESPRHGYEVIRLLQDRFMGVYAPSPGTIYPRLARLEEDGLVTHEEVDGKKVYSITDKGREEIRSRLGDLADLEDELTESLRDVAREISEDVRDTVRTIREELASAAREFRAEGGRADRSRSDREEADSTDGPDTGDDSYRDNPDQARRTNAGLAPGQTRGSAAAMRPGGSGTKPGAAGTRCAPASARKVAVMATGPHGPRGRSDWSPWSSWAEWTGSRDEPGEDAGGHPGRAPGLCGGFRRAVAPTWGEPVQRSGADGNAVRNRIARRCQADRESR